MNLADLKKIAANIAVISKTKTDTWTVAATVTVTDKKTWRRPEDHQLEVDYLAPMGTFKNRATALREARKLDKTVVAEQSAAGEMKILDCAVNTEYLNGLAKAAEVLEASQETYRTEIFHDPIRVIEIIEVLLEQNVQRAQHYMPFETVTPNKSLLAEESIARMNLSDDKYSNKSLSGFKLKDLQKISPRLGIIEDPQDGWGYRYKTTDSKSGVYRSKDLEVAQQALTNLFSCDTVAIKAPKMDYVLLYCDTAKNYLRGLTAAALLAHSAARQPGLQGNERFAYLHDQLLTLVNHARNELGYKKVGHNATANKMKTLRPEDKIKSPAKAR